MWNGTSQVGKELELLREVDIVGLTSKHSLGSGRQLLKRGWTLSCSGITKGETHWAGVGRLTSPLAEYLSVKVFTGE